MANPGFEDNLRTVTHLTFDCYGTLVDWELGILQALGALPWKKSVSSEAVLHSFVKHEAGVEREQWRPYREVLGEVMARMSAEFEQSWTAEQLGTLANSVADWPPFADTAAALRRLSTRYSLSILSNVDDDLFAGTQRRLGIELDTVVTAGQVRSYKPGLSHFHEAMQRLGIGSSQILHVAQSLYHDHVPAQSLGIRTVWVKRPSILPSGLAPEVSVKPDLAVTDLKTLADILLGLQSRTVAAS